MKPEIEVLVLRSENSTLKEQLKGALIEIMMFKSANARLIGELTGLLEGMLIHVEDEGVIQNIQKRLNQLRDYDTGDIQKTTSKEKRG